MRSWLLLACFVLLGIDSSLCWNKQSRWAGEPQPHYYPPVRAQPMANPGPPMGSHAQAMPNPGPPMPPRRQTQPSWNRYMRGGPMYDPNPQEGYPGPPLLSDPGYVNFKKFRTLRCNPPPTPPPNYYQIRSYMLHNPRLDISVSMRDSDQDCECMDKTFHRMYKPDYLIKPQFSNRCNDGRANNMVCGCSAPDMPEYHRGYGPPAPYGGYMSRGAPRAHVSYEQAVPGTVPLHSLSRPYMRY